MPVQCLTLVYHHFNFVAQEPFLNIYSSIPIRYSPMPEVSFEGIVLSKKVKWTKYNIWTQDYFAPYYHRKDIEITLEVALCVPTDVEVPLQMFPTQELHLEAIDAVKGEKFPEVAE